jgi:hypothetical protein
MNPLHFVRQFMPRSCECFLPFGFLFQNVVCFSYQISSIFTNAKHVIGWTDGRTQLPQKEIDLQVRVFPKALLNVLLGLQVNFVGGE